MRVDGRVQGDFDSGNLLAESIKLQLHGMPSFADYSRRCTRGLHTGEDQHCHRHILALPGRAEKVDGRECGSC